MQSSQHKEERKTTSFLLLEFVCFFIPSLSLSRCAYSQSNLGSTTHSNQIPKQLTQQKYKRSMTFFGLKTVTVTKCVHHSNNNCINDRSQLCGRNSSSSSSTSSYFSIFQLTHHSIGKSRSFAYDMRYLYATSVNELTIRDNWHLSLECNYVRQQWKQHCNPPWKKYFQQKMTPKM